MKRIFLFLCLVCISLIASDTYMEKISNSKIQKLVKKEEQIAKAYKEFIRVKGKAPTISDLKSNGFLPNSFSSNSFFKSTIVIDKEANQIKDIFSTRLKLRTSLLDYYYSDENRVYTKAAISEDNKNINIILDDREKYILKYSQLITTDKSEAKDKYYLDPQGILHWNDSNGDYKFSYSEDNLILDSSISVFNEDGYTSDSFNSLFENKEVLYAGQSIFILKTPEDEDGYAEEYLNLGEGKKLLKVGNSKRQTGRTVLQFTRRAGGMMVNGDIYTWGNNQNNVVATGLKNYTNKDGNEGNGWPVITTLVRAKAYLGNDTGLDNDYSEKFKDRNYFSSPLRPKFIDFTSDVWHSTCGVSTKGELYCAGKHALESQYINFETYTRGNTLNQEFLHRSEFFNGKDNKALRLFGLLSTWVVLGYEVEEGEENDKLKDSGKIYFWGGNGNGYGATGCRTERKLGNPFREESNNSSCKSSNIDFKDVTYTLSIPYRRIGGLAKDGSVYTWGLDNKITSTSKDRTKKIWNWKKGKYEWDRCQQKLKNGSYKNFCKPMRVDSDVIFTSILGGQQTFLATDEQGEFYRISQPMVYKPGQSLGYASEPIAEKITDLIKEYNDYNIEEDGTILSVDISTKYNGCNLGLGQGIVWVNGDNKLKGDYFTDDCGSEKGNKNDILFKDAIDKIKWKKIRVVEDKNGMCGIDVYNQMYCWGSMSFFNGNNNAGNTYMLPMFTANLHDIDKDFMLAAGGAADGETKGNVTKMTSGEWSRKVINSGIEKDEYFIKYPTYFGGFNYEFTFK